MSNAFETINDQNKQLDLNFFPSKFTLHSIYMKYMTQMGSSTKMIVLFYSKGMRFRFWLSWMPV
jgi:hypothetical protein